MSGYGETVFEGEIRAKYRIVPYEYETGEVVYDILGPDFMDSDELFESVEHAKYYAEGFGR